MSRTPVDILMDSVQWKEYPPNDERAWVGGDIPFVTHEGELPIGDTSLKVYQLSDGKRIIDRDDFEAFFGLTGGAADPDH